MDLRFIEGVTGVQSVADVGDGALGGQLTVGAVHLKEQRTQRIEALRLLHGVLPPGQLGAAGLQIGALIG